MSREMKHSGIEWIGEIPKEWNTISFNNGILRMSTGLNPRDNFVLSKDDEYYYVTIKNFKDGKIYLDENCDRINKQAWEIIQERSQLEKGDILFASISKDGQAYILEEHPVNWNINESVFSIRANQKYFYDKFFYYHIIDSEYYNDLRLDATGTTFQSIKQNKLRKSILCLPPLFEQQKIANYLDKVCGEVDEMIALQEQMIEELKAYKQSVITEAVTKGLNPNVPMKDSGIDWIGEIPEHWKQGRVKNLCSIISKGATPPTIDNDAYIGSVRFIKCENIYNNRLVNNSSYYISNETNNSMKRSQLEENDILFVIAGATIGKTAIVTLDFIPSNTNQAVSFLRLYKKSQAHYLWYILQSQVIQKPLWLNAVQSAQPNLSMEDLGNFGLPLPNEDEQQIIASYLDTKCAEIDALIAIKQAKIEELKDYKKSVIYEYVTGKKEVV